MTIRFAAALFALALPLAAQNPAPANEAEGIFYRAFYLEKGQNDFAGAMVLYEQFLEKAPEHKLAADAAKQQFSLLNRTGKTKERDAFKEKYAKLLGNLANAPAPSAGGGDRPARGDRPEGAGGRMEPAARIADLEKQLAKAKEDGNSEEQKKLEQQLERARSAGAGRGQSGQGRGRGLMGTLTSGKKVAEMSDEEITQLKEQVGQAGTMVERMREANPDGADKLEASLATLKKALDGGDKEAAQKAMDALREAMPRRRGGGGEAGGAGGEGGGNRGGGGGGGGR